MFPFSLKNFKTTFWNSPIQTKTNVFVSYPSFIKLAFCFLGVSSGSLKCSWSCTGHSFVPTAWGCPKARIKMLGHPLSPPQPGAPATLFCGDRAHKSFVLVILLCLKLHFWEGKGRGKHPPLCFPPPSEVSAVEEQLKWWGEVTDGDSSPFTSQPRWHRGQEPQIPVPWAPLSNPPAKQEAEHRPLGKANLRMVFRPPQRRVKKLWLPACTSVSKLPLNQRQSKTSNVSSSKISALLKVTL